LLFPRRWEHKKSRVYFWVEYILLGRKCIFIALQMKYEMPQCLCRSVHKKSDIHSLKFCVFGGSQQRKHDWGQNYHDWLVGARFWATAPSQMVPLLTGDLFTMHGDDLLTFDSLQKLSAVLCHGDSLFWPNTGGAHHKSLVFICNLGNFVIVVSYSHTLLN